MARKTSFYYSFLVLPANQRRAIVAVWDFCRAVDDAVDEAPTAADVTFTCETKAGNVDCLGHRQTGFANDALTGTDIGTDGVGRPQINLTVKDAAGNVEVRRG